MSDEQPQRPTRDDDRERWKAYWAERGMPWRTEPEIDEERQAYLTERRAVKPDIERGIYPFRDENGGIRLDRADVEWLLATHESGSMHGPVDWSDEKQHTREGLDLRGADLRGADLSWLPLSCMLGGLGADRSGKGGISSGLPMPDGYFDDGIWQSLRSTLAESLRHPTELIGGLFQALVSRRDAFDLLSAPAKVSIQAAVLPERFEAAAVHLEGATLIGARLEGAVLRGAYLEQALLPLARLRAANMKAAHMHGTLLSGADLVHAQLIRADLGGAVLDSANFQGADLAGAFLDAATSLAEVTLDGKPDGPVAVADVHWGDANLSGVDWTHVSSLGEERTARQSKTVSGRRKKKHTRTAEFNRAVIAYRQLATCLREQGLHEPSDRFAYRAQKLQRIVIRRQHKHMRYLGSLLLDVIAGYGYKPLRSFFTYLLVVGVFALTYYLIGTNVNPPLDPLSAIVFSITSFHGRGFAPGANVLLNNPLTVIAAAEAIIGLLIEITFIATFTQRFFAR